MRAAGGWYGLGLYGVAGSLSPPAQPDLAEWLMFKLALAGYYPTALPTN
ncbi:hypothetical protein [Paraburkholderia sp.]